LSLIWEPRWVRKTLERNGIKITTCVDEKSGFIMCPICGNIDEYCPPGKTTSLEPKEGISVFFSFNDLVWHLIAHAQAAWYKKRKTVVEVEEEEVEEEEEG